MPTSSAPLGRLPTVDCHVENDLASIDVTKVASAATLQPGGAVTYDRCR